jgi:hypothetical protein
VNSSVSISSFISISDMSSSMQVNESTRTVPHRQAQGLHGTMPLWLTGQSPARQREVRLPQQRRVWATSRLKNSRIARYLCQPHAPPEGWIVHCGSRKRSRFDLTNSAIIAILSQVVAAVAKTAAIKFPFI